MCNDFYMHLRIVYLLHLYRTSYGTTLKKMMLLLEYTSEEFCKDGATKTLLHLQEGWCILRILLVDLLSLKDWKSPCKSEENRMPSYSAEPADPASCFKTFVASSMAFFSFFWSSLRMAYSPFCHVAGDFQWFLELLCIYKTKCHPEKRKPHFPICTC